jgi:hypothetical protein
MKTSGPLLSLTLLALFVSPAKSDDALTFEKDIRPIFRAHCYDCHGATADVKGKLDLRLVRFLQKGGESGAAIVAGKPGESYLLDRLRAGEMPPGENTVPAKEISIIEKWIAAGAKTSRPEPESIPPGLGITFEERSFWSFQPIRRPDVADLSTFPAESRVRTPIDALVLKLSESSNGVSSFAPDADRRTLIKRAFLDLIGLPPGPDEMKRWLSNDSAAWYDELLTELLDSPHYGERWGRHWLDVAGYADSEGYTTSDSVRPWAWKYRDWVIRSLNEDKPFDRFLTEQLAGDELAGPREGDLKPEQIELLTATGFLRMPADGTDSGANNAAGRNQVMTDTLKIVGTSLLGLSLQCAQCHDHRYDPILQTDYYSLRAVFEPALDWKAWKRPRERQVSLYTEADRKKAAEIEAEAKKIGEERGKKQAEFMKQALEKELMKYEEPLRAKLREAYNTPGGKRTDEQKALLKKNPSVNINPGVLYQYLPKAAEELKKLDKQMADIRAKKPVEEFLRVLTEPPNHAPETKLFYRGDHEQPKQTVLPASLTLAAPEGKRREFASKVADFPTTGRRLAFARWLTSGEHPLFARVIVNRVWMHHFGKGLVETPSDFGKLGTKPTHPELLDWLADEFVRQGWSLKQLHRLIMTSTVWRQSAREAESGTPDSFLLRKRLVRLEAEAIRDRMLAASGKLNRTLFGKPVAIKEDDTGQVIVDGSQTRRSLYVQVRRSRPVAMMQAFDAPVMETNCEARPNSTVATQSLMLLNGEFLLEQAGHLAERVAKEPASLNKEQLAGLATIPLSPEPVWICGWGAYDAEKNRTGSFTKFGHWTGNTWQVGDKIPDPKLGFVFLNATGGHPDIPGRATIRRWTAPRDGVVSIAGNLGHSSPNGNGVEGLVVSSRSGKAGSWVAEHKGVETKTGGLEIKAGDTLDFITNSRGNHSSDSFSWTVTITLKTAGQPDLVTSSKEDFRGPIGSSETVPGQIVRAWELALCRPPSNEELNLAVGFVASQVEVFHKQQTKLPSGRSATRQAMTSLCQSLMSSNEFLYVY